MTDNHVFDTIHPSNRALVQEAIAAAFGDAPVQSLAPLSGGISGRDVLKLVVADHAYVLRIVGERTPLNDPQRQFACMTIAAGEGVAPPVRYTDPERGISIIDYIDAKPLRDVASRSDVAARIGEALRRLHDGPDFPPFLQTFQYIEGGQGHLAAMGAHLPAFVSAYFARMAAIRPRIEPHLELRPCHNDLNLNNLLFDGERVWLLDWEASCMGDPYHDLASITNWLSHAPEQQDALLHAYFGREPTDDERAKLLVMQQVAWWFYSTVFFLLAVGGGLRATPPDLDLATLLTYEEARQAMWAGTMHMGTAEDRWHLGCILAAESARALDDPAFDAALRTLGV